MAPGNSGAAAGSADTRTAATHFRPERMSSQLQEKPASFPAPRQHRLSRASSDRARDVDYCHIWCRKLMDDGVGRAVSTDRHAQNKRSEQSLLSSPHRAPSRLSVKAEMIHSMIDVHNFAIQIFKIFIFTFLLTDVWVKIKNSRRTNILLLT